MADVVNDFSSPTKMNNVVLVVEGKKLHVSKEVLTKHFVRYLKIETLKCEMNKS